MKTSKININIPEPCHENWQEMTQMNKSRFCNSCQKSVFDFTNSSDREISKAFENDKNLCGRFLNSQLERDLIIPQQKSSVWLATTSAIISFIGLGTQEAVAQGNVRVEQTDKKIAGKDSINSVENKLIICGTISGNRIPLKDAYIVIKHSLKSFATDESGKFKIEVKENDTLVFSAQGFSSYEKKIDKSEVLNIELYESINGFLGEIIVIRKRTFFGKIFHSIGNIFR